MEIFVINIQQLQNSTPEALIPEGIVKTYFNKNSSGKIKFRQAHDNSTPTFRVPN